MQNARTLAVIAIGAAVMAAATAAATATAGSATEPATNSIVLLEPGSDPGAVARSHGAKPNQLYRSAISGFAANLSKRQRRALLRDPSVLAVEDDLAVSLTHHRPGHGGGGKDEPPTEPPPPGPSQEIPAGVARINAGTVTADAASIDVAVIDTGVDLDHPDLRVVRGVDCTVGPNCTKGGSGNDGNGHGTHVAGTIGALDNSFGVRGVLPAAGIWAVRVLRSDGSGFLSDVIEGLDYVVANSNYIEVANLSLGAQGASAALRTAVQNLVASGVVVVVAAGNEGDDVYGPNAVFGDGDDHIPAAYPEVATVSALSDTDGMPGGLGALSSWGADDRNADAFADGLDDSFAFFSNFSQSVAPGNPVSSPGAAVDLVLPGVDIESAWLDAGYNSISGTSMAAPHAAGLAALDAALNGRALDATGVYAARQRLIDQGQDQASDLRLAPAYATSEPDANPEPLGWATR